MVRSFGAVASFIISSMVRSFGAVASFIISSMVRSFGAVASSGLRSGVTSGSLGKRTSIISFEKPKYCGPYFLEK